MGISYLSISQEAPVTNCASLNGVIPGQVAVPITVTGFTNIGAVSLSIDYDFSVIQFINGTPNSSLPGFLSGDYNLGNGWHRVSMGWYGISTNLPDNSTIMTLNFNYTEGNSQLIWYDNGPSCEYADAMGNVLNDLPQENFYINGLVCSAIGSPGDISGINTVCQGEQGIFYSIASLDNVTGYLWTVPNGAVIINGQNTNAITVDFQVDAISGDITVCGLNPCGNGPVSSLPINVNLLPNADAGNDTTINYGTSTTLHAVSGGNGSFSYHWSPEELLVNPDVQNPQTVILTNTTVFTLEVTNLSSQCQSEDTVIVSITGGPLSVNPIAMPASVCLGEGTQLYANAGGGSENYTYLWTCLPPDEPPWSSTFPNPVVTPDSSKIYLVNVNDGFTEENGTVSVNVYQLPEATISGGDTLCGSGNVTTLQVDLTGVPPWSFIYTNGITSWFVNDQMTSPYYILTGDPGIYTIIDLEDLHCSGNTYGSAGVYVFPYPDAPEITIYENNLISNICCGNQWYKDGVIIPGATGQAYAVTENGLYFDIVTINGCSSDTSEVIDMIVGIDEHKLQGISVWPNPAGDHVWITFPANEEHDYSILLITPDGRLVKKEVAEPGSVLASVHCDLTGIKPGLYIIMIYTSHDIFTYKLIIN